MTGVSQYFAITVPSHYRPREIIHRYTTRKKARKPENGSRKNKLTRKTNQFSFKFKSNLLGGLEVLLAGGISFPVEQKEAGGGAGGGGISDFVTSELLLCIVLHLLQSRPRQRRRGRRGGRMNEIDNVFVSRWSLFWCWMLVVGVKNIRTS